MLGGMRLLLVLVIVDATLEWLLEFVEVDD